MAYTNNDILNLINFTIRKENKGYPLTPNNYSLLLKVHGDGYYEMLYDQYERTQEVTDSLRRFKTTKSGAQLTFTGTTINLPSDYAHSGFLYYKKSGTDVKPVDLIDDDQFMMRQSSLIEVPSSDYPIARFTTDYIEYLPTTLNQTYFTFSYLREVIPAFYDYYIDANGVYYYLSAGEYHNWSDGETDSRGVEHSGGSASVSVDGYDYLSQTVELDFEEEDKLKIAYRILQAMSIPIDEAGVFQYAEQLKAES